MTSPKVIQRIEKLTWALIFGGLGLVVFAFVLKREGVGTNWPLAVVGAVLVLAGAALVYVRARLEPDA